MNLRGWISLIGLGVAMTGCAHGGMPTAMDSAAKPDAKHVAQALLSGERIQALAATEVRPVDTEALKARVYQALGAEREAGTYQALKAVLAK